MGNVILKGHISYAAKRKYRWIAEFGKNTCEKCAALDGKEFEEDEIPPRPHPNCRCKVEEISIVDEIESELNEYREEIEQLKLQADELLGDTSVLREQIEKLMKENNTPEVRTLDNRLEGIEYEVYKLIDKIEALNIDTISASVVSKIESGIENIRKNALRSIKDTIDTIVTATEYIRPDLHDGAGFWNVSSNPNTKGKQYQKQENAKVIKSLNDLDTQKLKDFISNKLKSQKLSQKTIGITYDQNSSVASDIASSQEFRTFIRKNKLKLSKERFLKDDYLFFERKSNLNLYLAIKHSDIIDIHLDSNNTLHAKVVDTYDFNDADFNPIIAIPRVLQKNGIIIPHYSITKIEIPESIWTKY